MDNGEDTNRPPKPPLRYPEEPDGLEDTNNQEPETEDTSEKEVSYVKEEFEGSDDKGDKCDESNDQGLNGSGDKNDENDEDDKVLSDNEREADNARASLQECSVSGWPLDSLTHKRYCICGVSMDQRDHRKKSQNDRDDHRDKKSKWSN